MSRIIADPAATMTTQPSACQEDFPCRITASYRPSPAREDGPRPPIALESVHAGFPSVAQDYMVGDFSLDDHVIPHPETTFIVSVAGDSMQGAGIWDGDLLIVDRGIDPQDGDVVIAAIDGDLTVKRLIRRGHRILLHPENRRYPDIIVEEPQSLLVWGVATGCYHPLRPAPRALPIDGGGRHPPACGGGQSSRDGQDPGVDS